MVSQVFYRKWRPQTLAEVVGQEPVTKTLLNALSSERVSHAYLFCGPRGTGKTSTGRILAKAINCATNKGHGEPCNTCHICQAVTEGRALDVIEIDAASNTGVDNIRDLRERAIYAPGEARYKVYIIDEVHMLSTSASNALLKTLEEPPAHVIFVLATTEAHKVLPTIASRCQRFDFRRISQADLVSKLAVICQAEGIHLEAEGLRLIAKSATGSLRDAENLLQQMFTYYGADIELHQVQSMLGITGDWRARELIKHIVNNDAASGIRTINSVNSDGLDLRQFNRELVEYLRALLLIKTGTEESIDLTGEDLAELRTLAASASLIQILKAVKLFGEIGTGADRYSTLPLELATIECVLSAGESKESPVSPVDNRPYPAPETAPKATTPKPVSREIVTPVNTEPPVMKAEATTVPEPDTEPPAIDGPPETAVNKEETQPQAPAATPQTGGEGTEIEKLNLNWKRIIEEAPAEMKKTTAIAILRSADVKPVKIDGDTVVLSSKFDFYKQQLEKPENQKVAEKIISSFLGRVCRVCCIHTPEDNHLLQAVIRMGAQVTSVEDK